MHRMPTMSNICDIKDKFGACSTAALTIMMGAYFILKWRLRSIIRNLSSETIRLLAIQTKLRSNVF